jgi:hypothetical protein
MSTTTNLSLPIYGPNHPDVGHDVGVNHNGAMAILDNAATVVAVPVSATAAGKPNQIAYDATHVYICVATNTWVRATLATW